MARKRLSRKEVRETRSAYRPQVEAGHETEANPLADWEWLEQNRSWLENQYAGRWIAIADRRIVGTGVKLSTAMKRAAKAGYAHPFVTAFRSRKYKDAFEVGSCL